MASALLAACGGERGPSEAQAESYMKRLSGPQSTLRPGSDANAAYADAMAAKARGDCAGAIALLRQVANLGPGYEGAQTALGDCLLQSAAAPAPSADSDGGLTWLRRAADAGWPDAQFRLARAYALGPAAIRNLEEAAFWFALYQINTGKSRVGFAPPPSDQVTALSAAIPPALQAAGVARAEKWERKVWIPPVPVTPPKPAENPAPRRQRRAAE
jgi:hypothetical protein